MNAAPEAIMTLQHRHHSSCRCQIISRWLTSLISYFLSLALLWFVLTFTEVTNPSLFDDLRISLEIQKETTLFKQLTFFWHVMSGSSSVTPMHQFRTNHDLCIYFTYQYILLILILTSSGRFLCAFNIEIYLLGYGHRGLFTLDWHVNWTIQHKWPLTCDFAPQLRNTHLPFVCGRLQTSHPT